jgi:D-alanyl-lipoteichoic acid acyltransferase DltB (MBOAT superfamily)
LLIHVLIFAFLNFIIGLQIPVSKYKKALFRTGIVLNLLQLIVLKYATFIFDPIAQLLNSDIQISKLASIIVPIGISYFTLQGIGYQINIKMGWEKPENSFSHFLLFITFFPKFLSGPIERSNHFLPQLQGSQIFSQNLVTQGMRLSLLGFFKKMVIANSLSPYLLTGYSELDSLTGSSLWILLLLQPLYLYFDFSGYTDIARGIAKMFGIDIVENFNRPFFAENVTTFWRRFHISLSSWFNDYVFKQTSFRYRKWGVSASVYALFLTWVLFGIWHGAGWTFMLLGAIQAIAMIYEFFSKKWRTRLFSKVPHIVGKWVGRIITYLFYSFSLVFFFSDNIKTTFTFFSKLTDFGSPVLFTPLSVQPVFVILYLTIILALEYIAEDLNSVYKQLEIKFMAEKHRVLRWLIYSLMLTLILSSGSKAGQFVYVNF